MAVTYEPIQTTTLGTAQASITFSGIAASWTDLRLVLIGRSDAVATTVDAILKFNASSTGYSYTNVNGINTTASSARGSALTQMQLATLPAASAGAGIFGLATLDVLSYAGSTFKTALGTSNTELTSTSSELRRLVHLWQNTAAITSIALTLSSGNYVAGTTATLYGIKAA